ncbi:hypothetical protein WJU16_03060 [Chitinophaga pollutisoli]|uniref:Uncharacterized protein n=1 Tax=Chitinophaga pollutisoli TaxID=3133966 RepID=A0ABZ2YQG9_9BACT
MNRNLLLIVALTLVGVLPAGAQNFSLPQLSPKSPNVAAFDKYGDIPVSPSTGQPQINIPLFATDIGGLPLKIDLSYQCNGFQPKEIASWIGYGWSLMVGGSISWQERGLNDFSAGGVITNWPQISNYRRGLLDATQQFYLFEEVMDQTKEMEFDRFNLSLMGTHQSFYFDTLKRVVLSPKSDLKISMITGGFKVLDIEGNQFF